MCITGLVQFARYGYSTIYNFQNIDKLCFVIAKFPAHTSSFLVTFLLVVGSALQEGAFWCILKEISAPSRSENKFKTSQYAANLALKNKKSVQCSTSESEVHIENIQNFFQAHFQTVAPF